MEQVHGSQDWRNQLADDIAGLLEEYKDSFARKDVGSNHEQIILEFVHWLEDEGE